MDSVNSAWISVNRCWIYVLILINTVKQWVLLRNHSSLTFLISKYSSLVHSELTIVVVIATTFPQRHTPPFATTTLHIPIHTTTPLYIYLTYAIPTPRLHNSWMSTTTPLYLTTIIVAIATTFPQRHTPPFATTTLHHLLTSNIRYTNTPTTQFSTDHYTSSPYQPNTTPYSSIYWSTKQHFLHITAYAL